MSNPFSDKRAKFSTWAASHLTADLKVQGEIFLDRLFQASGHGGSLDVGGEPQYRVRKGKDTGGGTGFANLVRKPVVAAAYGFSKKSDLLTQILAIKRLVTAAIEAVDRPTRPGIPAGFPVPESLVSQH